MEDGRVDRDTPRYALGTAGAAKHETRPAHRTLQIPFTSFAHGLMDAQNRRSPTSEAHHDTLSHRHRRRLQEVPDFPCLPRKEHYRRLQARGKRE